MENIYNYKYDLKYILKDQGIKNLGHLILKTYKNEQNKVISNDCN